MIREFLRAAVIAIPTGFLVVYLAVFATMGFDVQKTNAIFRKGGAHAAEPPVIQTPRIIRPGEIAYAFDPSTDQCFAYRVLEGTGSFSSFATVPCTRAVWNRIRSGS